MPVSKSRNKTAVEKDTQPVRRYATEKLLKSSHLKEYQPDFARVILTEPEYSVEEADVYKRQGKERSISYYEPDAGA